MTELLCEILRIKTINNKDYFLINSIEECKTYIIPTTQLLRFNVSVGEKHKFQKKQHKDSQKYFLEYSLIEKQDIKHKHYELNQIYDFTIFRLDTSLNKHNKLIPIIYVHDIDKNIIKVAGLKWQKESLWNFETLKCEVKGFSLNGTPQLINKDFRHPIYTVDQIYEFKVIEEKSKVTETGTYDYFDLQGEDGCIHQVNVHPSQKFNQLKLETVQCKILNISTHLRLTQANVRDPYYVSFEKIIFDKYLEKKHFSILFQEANTSNEDVIQLIEQYNSKSAFWVFTFTNKILVKQFRQSIDRQDYKEAREINHLIILFEEWILTKGIIKSFPDEEIRKVSSLKARNKLDSAKIRESALSILTKNPYNFLDDNSFFDDTNNLLQRFYYLFRYSNVEIIDCNKFIYRLRDIIDHIKKNCIPDLFYLNSLLVQISYSKKVFISEKEKEYFSLSSSKIGSVKLSENETKFSILSYGEILIAQLLSKKEYINVLTGRLLQLFTKSTPEIDKKECLLFNAYNYFENYQDAELQIPFLFKDELLVDFALLEIKHHNSTKDIDYWDKLEQSYLNKTQIIVRLTKKSKTGYEVNYNALKGILPDHHIKDRELKRYPFEVCDFTITANCLSISRPFNLFIIEQQSNSNYSYKNNIPFFIGNVYDAIVKNVVDFGLFLSTNAGEGLLYINDIFDFEWNRNNLSKYFKVGQQLKVVLKEISKDNKVSFTFLGIKKIDLLYYNEYVNHIFQKTTNAYLETGIEFEEHSYFDIALYEKAFCIEQFAVLQLDINDKIHNFQIAKQFYTNANNARSFLLNIYISYFEVLLNIKATLQNGSLTDIRDIKEKAQEIRNKINKKTIDAFPDSDKLIFFLDIVSMFNEKSETTFELLFEYIKKYNAESAYRDLKTIAKITLANNLLISESKEDSDFSLKNLRLIFDYLLNGILSLEETIEDKNARELKEEILYWLEKIKEDESETLEFKSSFFTPILDKTRSARLQFLKNCEAQTEQIKLDISRISGDLAKKIVIHSSLKTLVAFANTSGGTLLIGVDDKKNIIGLEEEFQTFPKPQDQTRDGFGKYFDEMIRTYIGDSFSSLMTRKFLRFPDGDVLIVKIKPSNQEVFLRKNEEGRDAEQLYIRNLSSSKELTGSELVKFIKNKLDRKEIQQA